MVRLAYRSEFPPFWPIHPVIYLEPALDDLLKRLRSAYPPAVSMEEDVGFYYVEKLIGGRQSTRASG